MAKTKIYLSKSKVGNPDDLMKMRHLLSKLDCEVLEFFGGTYSPKKLLSADILIVIPPHIGDRYGNEFDVGKGQYEEIQTFGSSDSFLLNYIDNAEFNLISIESCPQYPNNQNWQDRYGFIIMKDEEWDISDITTEYGIESITFTSVPNPLLAAASKYLKS